MTMHEIVALRCPSCGGSITQSSREMPFGAEFGCDNCGTTSVLIIDRALVPLSTLQKHGEKVCTTCGRVALREARFCQEGHPLVRRCIKCDEEFAVDHQLCDYCGWLQSVTPGTADGDALDFDRAVLEINDMARSERLWSKIEYPLGVIKRKCHRVSQTAIEEAAAAILNIIPKAGPNNDTPLVLHVWPALFALGPGALKPPDRQVVLTILRQYVNQEIKKNVVPTLYGEGAKSAFQYLCVISPEDALVYINRFLEESGKNDKGIQCQAVQSAFELGPVAIPTLEKFCGPFSGYKGRICKAAISALRNGEQTLSLP